MKFTWDEDKNIENQIKHGISFEEVMPMFKSSNYEIEFDSENSTLEEDRYLAFGSIDHHGEIVVVFVELVDDWIRIISARRA